MPVSSSAHLDLRRRPEDNDRLEEPRSRSPLSGLPCREPGENRGAGPLVFQFLLKSVVLVHIDDAHVTYMVLKYCGKLSPISNFKTV